MTEELFVLEETPDDVQATIEARDRALASLGSSSGGLEFTVDRLRRFPRRHRLSWRHDQQRLVRGHVRPRRWRRAALYRLVVGQALRR